MQELGKQLQELAQNNPEKVQYLLSQLSEEEAIAILYDWSIWGRDKQQYDPVSAPKITFWQCARGWGKTRTGSEAVRRALQMGCRHIGMVAPTAADVRDTMVLGVSGLLSVFPPSERPEYEPSYSRVVWPSGAQAKMYSAEKSDRLRGPQHEFCWMDEPASISDRDVFDQMMIGNRIGIAKSVVTGTPAVNDIVLELHRRREKDVEIRYGGIRENEGNLSPDYVNQIYEMYAGTHLEQSELEGVLVLSNPGALWTPDLINRQTVPREFNLPHYEKISIGIDPATTTGKTSDMTGIVVSMLGDDGFGYLLEDHTGKYSPDGWATKVLKLYDYYSQFAPTSIVVESNQGGQLCADNIRRNRPLIPVDEVFATRSKLSRAEPVAMLFEQGKVWMCRGLSDLAQEMVSFEGKPREKSPDRLDAAVYSILNLMPVRSRVTKGFELFV